MNSAVLLNRTNKQKHKGKYLFGKCDTFLDHTAYIDANSMKKMVFTFFCKKKNPTVLCHYSVLLLLFSLVFLV